MSESLAINRTEVLEAIGCPFGGTYALGDCFELDGWNWHPSVKALRLARGIVDGCTLRFEVATAEHAGWPSLVLTPDRRVCVLGEVPPGCEVLAVCFGISWPRSDEPPLQKRAA